MRPSKTRLLRQQGAALAEFVVLLPLLMVLLGAIYFVFKSYDAKQMAMLEARGCGWQYALYGCEEAPPGCSVAEASAAPNGFSEARAQLSDGSWIDAAINLPVIGPALEAVFGSGSVATSSKILARPNVLGGGEVRYGGRFYVLCNTRYRSLGDIAKEMFCKLIPRAVSERLDACGEFVEDSDQLDQLDDTLPDTE